MPDRVARFSASAACALACSRCMVSPGDDADAELAQHTAPIHSDDPALCPDGFARGEPTLALEALAKITPSPADVAVCPNGDVFVTLDGQDAIARVPIEPGGVPEHYADLTGVQPAGLACDAMGRLFVAAFALRQGSPYDAPGVLLVAEAGSAPVVITAPRGAGWLTPNGVTAADGVGIYVSDTLAGTITLIREVEGQLSASVEARSLLGVNGLGYDPASRELFATNSLNQALVSWRVGADGTLSSQRLRWIGPLGAQLDEVEVGENGQLFVAAYGGGAVYRVADDSVVARVTNPASLAFRGGSLLITDYHLNQPDIEGGLYQLSLGVCGAGVIDE